MDGMMIDVLTEQLDRPFAQVGAINGPFFGKSYEVLEVIRTTEKYSRLRCRVIGPNAT